jgi:SMODS domain-containing protein
MAFTVADSFARLRSNLEITDLQSTLVSTRQQTIRKTIDNGLKVLDDFLTGSYARSTMISPLSEADIDIFVCLDPAYYNHFNGINGGPAGLLELAKQTIRKTYSTTPDISRNGQAVTIRFADFVVDVVIGFHRLGGGYIIANSEGNFWLNTDPKKHVELMSEANKYHKGNLVPLIKMIKSWNKAHGAFFRSFHLEVLALEAFHNVTISDFPSGLRFFFDKAFTLVRGKNLDPAGYGDDIGRYITPSLVEEASRKFQAAFNTAVNAEMYGNRGDSRNAIVTWKALMPNHFPAYG